MSVLSVPNAEKVCLAERRRTKTAGHSGSPSFDEPLRTAVNVPWMCHGRGAPGQAGGSAVCPRGPFRDCAVTETRSSAACPPGRTGRRSARHRRAAGHHDSHRLPPPSAGGGMTTPRVGRATSQQRPKALGRARREGFERGPGGRPVLGSSSWITGEALRCRVCETSDHWVSRRPITMRVAASPGVPARRTGACSAATGTSARPCRWTPWRPCSGDPGLQL